MTPFLTLDEVDLNGQNVFLRLDLNMPLDDNGHVTDQSRLFASKRTLEYLRDHGAKTLIVTHLGRPKGIDASLSTLLLKESIEKLLGKSIAFAQTMDEARNALFTLANGDFVLLENSRFWAGEESNDENFSKELAGLASIYVNDAFSVSHRKHASVYGVPLLMPVRVAGYQLLNEITHLRKLTHDPKHPILTIVAGSKVSTKLALLKSLLNFSDKVIVGGAMANTFFVALEQMPKGLSFYEESMLDDAKSLYEEFSETLILPIDVVVADTINNPSTISEVNIMNVPRSLQVLDIGTQSIEMIEEEAAQAMTILWNGPVGVFEKPPFDKGSRAIGDIITKRTAEGAITIAGGGDTLACIGDKKDEFTFVSTAGAAFLEYLEKNDLPGVEILRKKSS